MCVNFRTCHSPVWRTYFCRKKKRIAVFSLKKRTKYGKNVLVGSSARDGKRSSYQWMADINSLSQETGQDMEEELEHTIQQLFENSLNWTLYYLFHFQTEARLPVALHPGLTLFQLGGGWGSIWPPLSLYKIFHCVITAAYITMLLSMTVKKDSLAHILVPSSQELDHRVQGHVTAYT